MPLEILSVGLLGILILGIFVPYWLKTKDLKKISSKNLPSDGHWAQLSKGNIYYRWHHPEQKNGQTIVMVHGFSTPSFVWNGLLDGLLNKGYSILVYDHYGRGFSERPRTKYSLDFYVETLKELVSHQNIEGKIHLVGYSMGGPIIGGFADKYSAQVKSLSFIAPAGFGKVQTSIPFFMKIPGVIIPSIAIWGDNDGIVSYKGAETYSEIFHEGKVITIEDGTHDITYRQPSDVLEAIKIFLASQIS